MLEIKNITKAFPGTERPVLRQINLRVGTGEFCVVLGSNGSGKSTLLKLISGEYSPDNGQVLFFGEPPCKYAHAVASVTQDISLGTLPEMTLLENLVLSSLSNKSAKLSGYQAYGDMFRGILKELNLEQSLNSPLMGLSGGQRQLIATIMAIISKPKLLLLDEHTSALDLKMQRYVMDYTARAVREEKLTTLMITHNFEDAIRYGNQLILIHEGTIVFSCSGKEKESLTIDDLLLHFHQSSHDQRAMEEQK
jgi:putative ABC transport system ATP-binding protein